MMISLTAVAASDVGNTTNLMSNNNDNSIKICIDDADMKTIDNEDSELDSNTSDKVGILASSDEDDGLDGDTYSQKDVLASSNVENTERGSDADDAALAVSDDENVLTDGSGFLDELIPLIQYSDESYITLNKSYIGDNIYAGDYINGMEITRSNFVLDGAGHVLNADSYGRVFLIKNNADNITFINIIFNNTIPRSDGGGAVLLNYKGNKTISFINCTFMNSNAKHGGAIKINGNNVTIRGCTFLDCIASSTYGGAIYVNGSYNLIENCTFSYCRTTYGTSTPNGGAIMFTNGASYNSIKNCIFSNNTAYQSGGAVYVTTSDGNSIVNCTFIDNRANILTHNSAGGGAIYLTSFVKNFLIDQCIFIGNTATLHGGAVNSFSPSSKITGNCIFINNSASDGGAIYAAGITVDNSTFINNTAETGGAISIPATKSLIVSNCEFIDNNATSYGGAIHALGACQANFCNFDNNTATYGGAIFQGEASILNVFDSNFRKNEAYDGGAIYCKQDLQVYNCLFENNKANNNGGVVYSNKSSIYNSDFIENSADNCAGAVYAASSVTIDNSLFEKNNADIAGAIYTAVITANFVNFTENFANIAGALELDSVSSIQSRITDSYFSKNNATIDGGAIYSEHSVAVLESVQFISNYAGNDAGAIFWKKGKGQILKSTFYNNTAVDDGGAIYWEESNGYVSSSFFNNNKAQDKGGAIYWYGDGGTVTSSNFDNNTAGTKGNTIYWFGVNGTLDHSVVVGNGNLGTVYWHGSNGTIKNTEFEGVRSVYVCKHTNVAFEENTQLNANYDSYSILNEGNITLSNNNFHNAIYNNGLILSNTSVVVLDNITVITPEKFYEVYTGILDDNGNYIKISGDFNNSFDSINYTPRFNNTHYVFQSPFLELGVHYVNAAGDFSELLNNEIKPGILMYIILDINITSINYGEIVVINTTAVNTTLNGTIILYLNDQDYQVPLSNGSAVLTLHNLAPNSYRVISTYTVYNQTVAANDSFIVELRNSSLIITANNITAGEDVIITVNVTNGTTGNVYIFVNNNMYIKTLSNSTTQLNLTNIVGGIYSIYAIYNGDSYYKSCFNSTVFSATKIKPIFIIDTADILCGNVEIVSITSPDNITGSIYVYADNELLNFTHQPISFTLSNLTAGNHTIRVMYNGDNKYLPSTNETTFMVYKNNITLSITTYDIKVGQNETVEVSIPNNVTGSMVLTVNSNSYYIDVNSTKVHFLLSGLAKGTYNVTATYLEDDFYYSKSVNSSFNVDYANINPIITSTVDSDLNAIINVTLPNDVSGDMIININGENHTVYAIKGLVTLTVNNLTGGIYPGRFYLENDSKYGKTNKSFIVELNKLNPTINTVAPAIYVDDNATITVTVPNDATGNVTLKISNKTLTETIVNGTVIFNVSGLKYGNYSFNVTYSGDRKYNSANDAGVVVVMKVDINAYAYMEAESIFVGQNATVNIYMPKDATGNVTLYIQGNNYTVYIINGTGQKNISGLKYGVPVPIYAEYSGDDKYTSCEREYPFFSVHRISIYDVDIQAKTNSTSANITVIIPKDANGDGNITINNVTYPVVFVNGTANITADNLTAGKQYVVYAYFGGDDKYAANDASKTLNSNKTLDYVFDVTVKDILVGETAYLNISLPNATDNDTVTVRVPGRSPQNFNVINGSVLAPIADLEAGSYLVSVTYNGNEKYDSRSRYGNISVSKINAFTPVIVVNTPYVGNNLTFNITLPSDSSGNISIKIANRTINTTVINGTAFVSVPGLAYGTYGATVFYSGDHKYYNKTNVVEAKVLKIPDYLFAMNVTNIKVGENETIYIYLPNNTDGNLTISIVNTTYINKTVEIINGTGSFNASGLAQGIYRVDASFVNDSIYVDKNIFDYFTVSTIEGYKFNLTNNESVYVRDNVTFTLELPEDATGKVNLTIFDETHQLDINKGIATINLTAKAEGVYAFIISFEQPGKYNYKSQEGYVFVSKKDVILNPIYNKTVGVEENVSFIVQLPEDATGNISLTTRGLTYCVNLTNGYGVLTILGYPLASVYSPMLSYTGDDKYNPATLITSINVIKISDYDLNVTVSDIDVYQDEIVNITLPSDATDDVLIYGNFSNLIYSATIVNGNVTFVIPNLPTGTYNITVRYQGYKKYDDKNVTKTFTVRKVIPEMSIEFINNNTIVVVLPDSASGLVNITVGTFNYINVTVGNGRAILDISDILPGDYTVNATYGGDSNYLENNATKNITIPRITDYILPISVSNITLGENATIVITAPVYATGFMNITIDSGEVIEVEIKEGKATYIAQNLKVGNHTVVVNYTSDIYDFKSNSTIFNVGKIKTVITDIVYGNSTNITVEVNLTEGVNGNLTIMIGTTPYEFYNLTSNKVNLTVSAIPKEYDIRIIYSGDENHTSAEKTDYIVTHKISDYELKIDLKPVVTVLENNVITVTLPKGITGTVHFFINGLSYPPVRVNSTTGKAILTLPLLASNNYTVIAEFGNEYYETKENSTNFTVIKLNTTISLDLENITKDLTEVINVTLNETTSGNVLINVNGTIYYVEIENGVVTLPLSNLNDGNYTVAVTYLGDSYFNTNSTTGVFTVSKIPVGLNITGEDITVGNEANFVIEVSNNITSLITVTINNKNYTSFVYNGKGNLTVTQLPIGEYNVTAYYLGDEDYLPISNMTKINVAGKNATSLIVKVSNITVGQDAIIQVIVNGADTGNVTLFMSGNPKTLPVVNGTVNFTVSNLTARSYHFTVMYLENNEYLSSNATGDFVVNKKNATVRVQVANIFVGDTELLNVTVPQGAEGIVLVSLLSIQIYAEINGTTFTVPIPDLDVGKYNVTVTYLGDDNYNGYSTNDSFNVTKFTTTIIIEASNITVAQIEVINITTSANITEVVIIEIDGINYTSFVVNGKGNFTIYNLKVGNYTATVYFPGNSKYNAIQNSTEFNVVGKKDSAISVNASSIIVGDDAVIYVNVTSGITGRVTISIAGETYTKELDADGKANFTISDLNARLYHVTAYYRGNDDYEISSANTTFTVYKKNAPLSANVTNSTVGSVEYINVTAPVNATGHVLISINGTHYYSDLDGGIAKFNITGLLIGNYTAYITYVGDSTYNESSIEVNLTITKQTTTISITTNSTIVVGHPVEFNIATSANITEVVTVTIDQNNYTTFVENGKGTFTVYNLAAGNYTAHVYFPGNTRYDEADNSTDFKVTGKSPVSIRVKVENITLGENATVYVTVNVTNGKVTLNIDGRPQTKDVVDGKVNFTVSGLLARDYHLTATYLENDNYLSNSTTADITVFRKQSEITMNVSTIYVGEYEIINVTVSKNATGIILISIAGVHVYAEIVNGSANATFNDLGLGEYNVTATYLGDENYYGNSTNASFNVTKLETTIIIKGNNITVGQTEIFNITTSANITEVVIVEIDGNNYTSFVENGKGTFIVPYTLAEGNCIVYVYFPGNSRYDAVENSTNITVSPKKASAITVNVESITVGDDVIIYVNVTDGATGQVAISIAGNAYSILLNNSRGNITLTNLTARNYHVSAFYFGDEYYLPSNNTADFVVNKKLSQLNVTAINITVDDNEVIKINITNGTTGVVLIDINGTDYYANIDDGIAILTVKNLAVGTYNVTVRYNGDANYNATVNSTKFSVTKLSSIITVEVMGPEVVAYGNDVLINVTGPKDVTGIAIVTVKGDDETLYTVYINNGEGSLIITKPSVNNYTVSAVYQENYKYLSNSSNIDQFEVYANGSSLDVHTHNIYVGDNETIIIIIAGDYGGKTVNITIDGSIKLNATFNYNGNSSVATLNYTAHLDAGIHQVDAAFVSIDDERNVTHSGSSFFIVSKNNSTVGIEPVLDIKVGENVTINLTLVPSDASGTIDVYVNGELHVVNVDNLTLTISNLSAGHYIVQAMYGGDTKYLASSANASFDVYKNDIKLVLDVESINVGETEYLNVTLESDATGYVLININGTHYYAEIKDGVARVNITDLGLGKYNVNVTYVGNDKYYRNYTTDSFCVSKLTTTIEIKGQNITVGQTVNFTITTSDNITEVVIIEIGGKNYTAFIENGNGNFSLSGLSVNNYNATVYFPGNSKYGAVNNTTKFTVKDKYATSINVSVADITVGDNITVYVNATEGINGPVYVTIGGIAYTHNLVNGKVNFTVSNLIARDYMVSAFFMGNEEYELCNTTSNFTVHKKNTPIDVEVAHIKLGDVEMINVTVDSNASGNVLISIGSIHVYAELNGGRASANITGLTNGTYNVTVTYVGDDNYNSNSTNASFNVTKLSTTITITCDSPVVVGQPVEFTIVTSANITEVVTVTIGDAIYHTFVENGKGNFTVRGLADNDYIAYVNFPGNTQYGEANNETKFKVIAKKPSAVTVNVTDSIVGQTVTITVNVTEGATGNVTIVVAGEAYTKVLTGSEVVFTFDNLTARDYHVTAYYRGDDYYLISNNTAEFTVSKLNTTIDVAVTNSTVGSVEYINVTVNANATGNILISIGESRYYAVIENGVAKFSLTGLLVGNYTANITYLGDAKFNNNAAQAKITISKIATLITIDGSNIIEGQIEKLIIKTSENITALVKVQIGNVNYTTFISEGVGELTVENLTADTYTAIVYYTGDNEFIGIDNSTTFTVFAKKNSAIAIEVNNITVGENATIKVTVTPGATGNVTIVIAGHEISKEINSETGEVIFEVSDLIARNYEVTAIYPGDTNYNGNETVGHFSVNKMASNVELNVSDIVVGDTEVINVTVTPGATGVVLINISGTLFYADLKDGMPAFKVPGLTAGNYKAIVTYLGDDKYLGSNASKTFVVQPEITLTPGVNDGNKTPITIDVGDNSNGTVVVTINGTDYPAKVENGTATVYVNGNNPGTQNATVTFTSEGKDPIAQNITVDIPKVSEYPVDVQVTNVDKENGTATIKVQAPKDATGNVTVTVNGTSVTVPLDENGTAVISVNDIPVGSHDIDVSYSGDDKYVSKSNRTHVNMPINLPTVNVVDHLVRGWNSQFDYEAVFTNEFGEVLVDTNVTFIVNGKSYSVKTESHGIARLSETLPVGEYTITSINSVTGEQVTKKLSIVPRLKYNKDLTMDFIDGSHWDVLVIGDDGNPVGEGEIIDIYVNTIHYVAKTDKDGYARLKINLNPKTYKISAEYKNYKVNNKLVVKQTMKLVKKTVTAKKGKKITIKVKLKWSSGKAIKGKKIVIKFKGKKFSAKTNKKGIAKITIKKKSVLKKLKKGKKYSYAAIYNKTNKLKGKVKIK